LGPDLGSLQRALEAGAGAVVIVHLYGVPVDLRAIEPLVRHAGAVLIEDAAQGVGTRIGGRPAGAFGRFGILSFGRGKGLTGGRGGALLANDSQGASGLDELRAMLTGSRGSGAPALAAQLLFGRPALYGIPLGIPFLGLGDTVYRAPHAPAPAEPFSLGVLARTQQLSVAESAQRRAHARRLLDAIARAPGFDSYGERPDVEPGYLRLPVRAHDAAAAAARTTNAHRLGIWPSYPRALADLEGFGDRRLDAGVAVPGARELARRALTLPTHSRLGQGDLETLEHWLQVHAVHERSDDRG
jgi:dTDP-4-amino-4,6-dideoxygalactose transaminase